MASGGQRDPQPVIKVLMSSGLINKNLMAILKAENLSATGNKADMQNRITQRLKHHASYDPVAFDRLKKIIENPKYLESLKATAAQQSRGAAPHLPYHNSPSLARFGGMNQYEQEQRNNGSPRTQAGGLSSPVEIEYKPSPFWKIVKQLGDTKECAKMEGHRNSVQIQLKLSESEIQQLDLNFRVMMFCGKISGPGNQDISFPQQSEIKVNGEVNRKNIRGIKNKPGTTRPLDITGMLKLKPAMSLNNIDLIYALTREAGYIPKYYLSLKLVEMFPVEVLVEKLASGQKITKASVVNELTTNARDEDIVVGTTVLSLKCPLSTKRICLPCRSITCRHIQCFDATSYLQLQEQAPTWQCPICNKSATYENIAVDEYVREILTETPENIDQVTVEPDGTWFQRNKAFSPTPAAYDDDDDDDDGGGVESGSDIIEIKNTRIAALKNGSGTPKSPSHISCTPPGSREHSSSLGPSKSSNRKRVIDLTSDDEDEAQLRTAKRPHLATPSGVGVQNGGTPTGGGIPGAGRS